MKILLVNNYDSFVFNLYHLVKSVATESTIDIAYNDDITVDKASSYDRIIISPGPGIPSEAGLTLEIVKRLSPAIPILGVCLGHQIIAQAFGAEIFCLQKPFHGIKDTAQIIDHADIFRHIPDTIFVGRYHSWVVSKDNLPDSLNITAVDATGNIMAISHKKYDVHGVQFHPESIMTPLGRNILANFI